MKQQQHTQMNLAGLAARCFGAFALCALALAPTFAFGTVEREKIDPLPGSGSGVAIGDETIGTLPLLSAGNAIQLVYNLPITRPSLFMEGELFELQNAISFFEGTGRASVVSLGQGRVRLVFVDEVLLGFDRLALQGADIQFGLWVPAPVQYAYPNLSWGGRTIAFTPTQSRLALPIRAMSANGALDASPLMVESDSWSGTNALMAAVDQDFLYLVQRQ